MSEQAKEQVSGPSLEYIDIINATKIMEAAIERSVFNIKELAEVAPIVSRFQDFSAAIMAEQEAAQADGQESQEGE
jgi:hypothetical protein